MTALQISIPTTELSKRMKHRLSGSATMPKVVWQEGGQRVLIHLDSLIVRSVDGWLLCHLELETDPTKRQKLQFVYFVGRSSEGGGINAGSTINAATVPASQLADKWGADVQRVLWDAVLDGIEGAIAHAKTQATGQKIRLAGFTCVPNELHVNVLAGDR